LGKLSGVVVGRRRERFLRDVSYFVSYSDDEETALFNDDDDGYRSLLVVGRLALRCCLAAECRPVLHVLVVVLWFVSSRSPLVEVSPP
jgi:hypothetical protein